MYITLQDQPDGSLHMPSRSLVSDKTLSQSQPLPVHADSNHETLEKTKRKLNVTSVHLDHPSISTMMAARLATSLISHILFLKNQVPLPVVQLSRMPSGDSKSRAVRRRTELVAAMDTLSSHLQTTFVALSAALCQKNVTDTSTNQNERVTSLNATTSRPPAQAHMAVVVGPNVGAAKAKVLLVFDGLEVKHWGVREDTQSVPDSGSVSDQEQDGSDDTDDIAQSSEEEDSADFSEEHEDSVGESMPESEEEYQDCIDYCNRPESPSSPPPHSRSPSPSPPMQIPTTLTRSSRLVPSSILSISTRIPSRTPSRDTSPVTSHEEIQKALTAADRLLSRTLASACAEDGGGLSCELAPTQTHILLRAPRRFTHPSWIPRQNLTRTLESTLQTFLEDVFASNDHRPQSINSRNKHPGVGIATEGVWIGCQYDELHSLSEDRCPEEEDDEMIWWAWNGKIVGFSEW